MWCMKCNNELSECVCLDLQERLESLKKCDHVFIGDDYKERIAKKADENKATQN